MELALYFAMAVVRDLFAFAGRCAIRDVVPNGSVAAWGDNR